MPSIAIALALAAAAGLSPAGTATRTASDHGQIVQAQAQGGYTYRRDELRDERRREGKHSHERHRLRNTLTDCHRDVRTHWINGALVTHRHVGDDCSVRIARRYSVPGD